MNRIVEIIAEGEVKQAHLAIINDAQLRSEAVDERKVFLINESFGVVLHQVGNDEGTLLVMPDVLVQSVEIAAQVVKSGSPGILTVSDMVFDMNVEQANDLIRLDELNQVISEIVIFQSKLDAAREYLDIIQSEIDAAQAIIDIGVNEVILSPTSNDDMAISSTSDIDFSFIVTVTATEKSNGDTASSTGIINVSIDDFFDASASKTFLQTNSDSAASDWLYERLNDSARNANVENYGIDDSSLSDDYVELFSDAELDNFDIPEFNVEILNAEI